MLRSEEVKTLENGSASTRKKPREVPGLYKDREMLESLSRIKKGESQGDVPQGETEPEKLEYVVRKLAKAVDHSTS